MRWEPPLLSRRTFLSALTSVVPAMAGADQRDGLQPSDALAVSPLDEWGMVETTTGRYLIGELIIRNRSRMPRAVIELRLAEQPARLGEQPARLGEQPAPPTVRLTGADLLARMANGSTNLPVASRNLAGGDSVLVFLWEPISAGATIRSVALDVGFEESSSRDQTITIPLTSPLVEPVRVHPPLAGGPWVALYDPHMPRGHRRVAFARGGRQVVPARFAIDWVRLDETGLYYRRWYRRLRTLVRIRRGCSRRGRRQGCGGSRQLSRCADTRAACEMDR